MVLSSLFYHKVRGNIPKTCEKTYLGIQLIYMCKFTIHCGICVAKYTGCYCGRLNIPGHFIGMYIKLIHLIIFNSMNILNKILVAAFYYVYNIHHNIFVGYNIFTSNRNPNRNFFASILK